MPELPEVETVRRGLQAHLPGRTLDEVEFTRSDLRWPIPVQEITALVGRKLATCRRRSKYLLLDFAPKARDKGAQPATVLAHLGMSGRMFVNVMKARAKPPEWQLHEHWRFRLGTRLVRYVDPRRFGILDLIEGPDPEAHRLLERLGPEPLTDAFDGAVLFAKSRKRKVQTKAFIMDAHTVVGVGNIYASEACFRAGIRPRRAAGRLSRVECDNLASTIREVLQEAIEQGGTTLRDYVGVDSETGYFQRELMVYGREGEPCVRCETPVRRTIDNGRSTFWCAGCQT